MEWKQFKRKFRTVLLLPIFHIFLYYDCDRKYQESIR